MEMKTLLGLEQLNQLKLTEEERATVSAFFDAREADMAQANSVPTDEVARMVWVMPMANVMRADQASQPFSREDLQAQAPEIMDDYWQVPRVAN